MIVEGVGAARAGVTSDRAHTLDYPSGYQRSPAVRPVHATGLDGKRTNAFDETVGARYVPRDEDLART